LGKNLLHNTKPLLSSAVAYEVWSQGLRLDSGGFKVNIKKKVHLPEKCREALWDRGQLPQITLSCIGYGNKVWVSK